MAFQPHVQCTHQTCTDQAIYNTVKEIHRWRETYISYYPCSIERVRGGLIRFHEDHVDAIMLRKDPESVNMLFLLCPFSC